LWIGRGRTLPRAAPCTPSISPSSSRQIIQERGR
jgi:hypothetical protein